jgi:hypothetical protein
VSTLVVLGAGDLGGAVARQAVSSAVTRRVVLVDDAADVARGKALDIRQAGAIDGVAVDVIGTGDLGAVVGASVVVLADRHATPAVEYHGDEALRLLARTRALNPRALIVCAGATQLEVVERMVHERDAAAAGIVGSAPEALRNALVALASLESGSGPRDVSLMLLGRPPRHALAVWNDASIGGRRATDVLDPPAIARLDGRLPHLWPPGPLALGVAAVRMVALAVTGGAGTPSVFVVPAAPEGVRLRGVALPAIVCATGVTPIWPALSPRDRTRLESALGSG